MECNLGPGDTTRWHTLDLVTFKILFAVIQCICFTICMIEHLCNVSITTVVKQGIKSKDTFLRKLCDGISLDTLLSHFALDKIATFGHPFPE